MGVHEDTLQGLNEALEYIKGDDSKGRSTVITTPNDDISMKFYMLPEEDQKTVMVIIDKMLVANNR